MTSPRILSRLLLAAFRDSGQPLTDRVHFAHPGLSHTSLTELIEQHVDGFAQLPYQINAIFSLESIGVINAYFRTADSQRLRLQDEFESITKCWLSVVKTSGNQI